MSPKWSELCVHKAQVFPADALGYASKHLLEKEVE